LPTPALYRDFIGHTLNKDKLEEGQRYFSELYGSISEPTYPFNLSDTRIDGGATIRFSQAMLSPALRDTIRQVAGELQISPAVLFHAAFGLVVARCSNTEQALFGSVLLGRLQGAKGSASSLGLFMNTLPIVLDLKGNIPSYINHTNERLQALLDYEQTPLSKIHQWSGISNDTPMFSALLNYRHSTPGSSNTFSDFGGEVLTGEQRTNYPFSFDVDDYGDDFGFAVRVVDIGIDPSTIISYMKESLRVLLGSIDKRSEITVGDLSIVSEKEKHQVLEVFNDTAFRYPSDKTVVDLFAEQAKKTPEGTAIIFEGGTLNYRELDERSNQLAHFLIDKGVSVEELVGVCLERGPEMMVSLLGILKSGGAYIPIDPTYPETRINYLIKDAAIDILITTTEIIDRFSNVGVEAPILLDVSSESIRKASKAPVTIDLSVHNLAYTIYTSGSTGRPKGVQVEHNNIVSLATSCDYVQLNNETVWLSTGSISFDATTMDYWGTLLNGGKLVLANTETLLATSSLKALILETKVTALFMTTSWFHQIAEEDLSVFASLDYFLVGGDITLYNYTNKLKEQYPELTIIHCYGPTENTTFSTTYPLEITKGILPIGKPIKNSYAYITDKNMNVVPIGVIGELVLGGTGVARGYLNNKELTNEKFIDSPFKEADRLYKTGDLAKWLPDGNIEFVGRKDDQVKIRGYRIELGEIENTLSLVQGVRQCCILAKSDNRGDKRLIGYVVLEGELDKEALQQQLQQSLPEYMVPRLWVQLDEMPLTANGKLDRKALPKLDPSALSTKTYVAPRTETEEKLVAIWKELLGLEKIGIYDNFFELGGHSLLAVQLISRIRKEMDIEIAIQDVFELNCIEQLGNYIQCLTLEDDGIDDEILFEQSI
ncbi:MAG: amino acid adenylation domain-containing protein, partial [Bacteroidota bacterium]